MLQYDRVLPGKDNDLAYSLPNYQDNPKELKDEMQEKPGGLEVDTTLIGTRNCALNLIFPNFLGTLAI